VEPTELLVVTSLPHEGSHSLFLEAIKVDTTSLLGFSLVELLYAWSVKSDIGG
jgi:predicted house-cleaning NTP pyrophosphatase (Maf/HAM1 superfamily)